MMKDESARQQDTQREQSISVKRISMARLHEFRRSEDLAREHRQRYLSMVPCGAAADDARKKIRELAR